MTIKHKIEVQAFHLQIPQAMKKLFSLLIVALFATTAVLADDVSAEQALQIARQFAQSPQTQQLSRRKAPAKPIAPTMAHVMRSKASQKDNVYVVNLGNGQGFVIVSAEDGADDIVLGYCDHGDFSYDDCPIQLKDLLGLYASQVDSLRQDSIMPVLRRRAGAQYDSYLGTVVVEPLLTSTWNQCSPYNLQCPEVTPEGTDLGYGYGGRYATGCVPTAIAQIMRYWRWPQVTSGTVNGNDFSGHTYDWDNMLDNFRYGYSLAQADAVAKLMADVGYAMWTAYGQPNGSPTQFSPRALIDNFGYAADVEEVAGSTASQLKSAIKEELDENRPVPYSGHPSAGDGHALVCDGYTSKNYFHFNYGWGGHSDGWYKLSYLPIYRYNATIWKNFRPYDAIKKVVDGVEYGLLKNGTAEIIDYPGGGMGVQNDVLEIPSTIEHDGTTYQVNRIRQRAFYRKGSIKKLIVGDNIEVIEPISFFYTRIDTLVLGDSIKAVPDEAFAYTEIRHLTIGKNVQRIGKKAFFLCYLNQGIVNKSPAFEVDDEAFANTRPKIGEWLNCITYLGRQAFAGANFGDRVHQYFTNLEVIGDSAFYGANFGTTTPSFRIYSKVREIVPSAFDGWNPVSTITVEEDNPYFSVEDAIGRNIYNKSKTTLLISFRERPDGAYPSTLVKLAPRSMRPGREWNTIPAMIVEMGGAFQDIPEISNPFKCLAVVPPIIPDDYFEGKIDMKWATLQVPAGTEDAYHNARGWRHFPEKWTWDDGIARGIIGNQAYNPLPAQGREYYMVINGADNERQRLSIPVSEVRSMELSEYGRHVVIKRNGKDDVTTTVASVDSITWMPGFVFENAEVFELNDSTLTVDAQKCSIQFDATCIDEDVQLCVRNAAFSPNVPDGMVDGFAIDLSLSTGQHMLDGTVDITVPFPAGSDEYVGAVYYNEETGEWEPVCFEYDRNTGTMTIRTNHLSIYQLYRVIKSNSVFAMLDPVKQVERMIAGDRALKDVLVSLIKIVQSEFPEMEMVNQFKDEMSLWQTVGLDGLWSAVRGTGEALVDFRPEKLDKIVEGFGYLGLALSIYDVARAEANGDDIQVAAGSMKTILNYSSLMAGKAIGTPIFSTSMAMVAFIGIALDKFGTKVAESKYDKYSKIYRYFYSRRGKNDPDVRSCYRSAKDWYQLFYPVVAAGKMTEGEWKDYIKSEVEDYCNQIWTNDYDDAYESCYWICETKFPGASIAYPEESIKQRLSLEHFAALMNGELVSVTTAIKRQLQVEAFNRYVKAFKDVAKMVNAYLGLHVFDSECKEGETSKYAGWKVGLSEIPSFLKGSEYLKKTFGEKGYANLGYMTEYCLVSNEMPTQITLYDPDDNPQKTFDFQIPEGEDKVILDIDIATGGTKADKKPLEGLKLAYDPNVVQYPFAFDNDDYNSGIGLLYLDNAANNRARFQTAVEQFFNRHDFITVDKYGNFKIGDDIIGRFEGNGLESSGKFVIDVSHKYREQTVDQWIAVAAKPINTDWGYGLLNGIIQHRIECNYTITRTSTNSNEFKVSYTGSGDYALLANVIARVEGVDAWDIVDAWKANKDAKKAEEDGPKIDPSQITQQECSYDGKVTLEYSTTLETITPPEE